MTDVERALSRDLGGETWACRECGNEDGPLFDRSLCGRCDSMHYYCGECGEQDDLCIVNGVELPN